MICSVYERDSPTSERSEGSSKGLQKLTWTIIVVVMMDAGNYVPNQSSAFALPIGIGLRHVHTQDEGAVARRFFTKQGLSEASVGFVKPLESTS